MVGNKKTAFWSAWPRKIDFSNHISNFIAPIIPVNYV